jgi:hypothetical protein
MRDYRDAKIMARMLREALAAKHHKITVGESLEMIARLFGVADWNTLSAIIKNSEQVREPSGATGRGLRFARTTEQALHRTIGIAAEQGHSQATVEHLLLALIRDPDASAIMKAHAVDVAAMRKQLTCSIQTSVPSDSADSRTDPSPSPAFQRLVQRAILDVQEGGGESVTGAHLLAAIFSGENGTAVRILREHGVDLSDS